MKTLQDLFSLVAKAIEQNGSSHWFINYSGHVNKIYIKFYFTGWSEDKHFESAEFYLTEEGIQGAYWYIKTKL